MILAVRNATIRNNTADSVGGGIGGAFQAILVENVTFENNHGGAGGALAGRATTFGGLSLEVRNCTLTRNSSDGDGAGSGRSPRSH